MDLSKTWSLTFVLFCSAQGSQGVTLEWVRQPGTSAIDIAYAISADGAGNAYTTGITYGRLAGPHSGASGNTDPDVFLQKYDSAGNLLWGRQIGTSDIQDGRGVSADGLGNVYITGWTRGNLISPSGSGGFDAYVVKYDGLGNRLWTRQITSGSDDHGHGISADGLGNVYLAGHTNGAVGGPFLGVTDGFLSKFNGDGTLLWSRQLASAARDRAYAVSADKLGHVFVAGYTEGTLAGANLGGSDAFVAKYDALGNLQWSRQFGSETSEEASGVVADGLGNVFVTGTTWGSLGGPTAGGSDAFLSKFDSVGNLLWSRQFGDSSPDEGYAVASDGLGNAVISGSLRGNAFVAMYDVAGNQIWNYDFGTSRYETARGVSVDGLGNVFLAGRTDGNLAAPLAGTIDAFLAKVSVRTVPEPGALLLLGQVLIVTTALKHRARRFTR